jgi:fructose-bisphosphate aldolase class I
MQQAARHMWAQDLTGNVAAAQNNVVARARDNGLAALGQWKKAA